MAIEINSSFTPGPVLITALVLSEASCQFHLSQYQLHTLLFALPAHSTKLMIPQQIWPILADNGLLQLHERKKCPSEVPRPCDFSHLQKPLLSLWKEDVEPWLMDGYLEQIICSFALFKIKVSVSYLGSMFLKLLKLLVCFITMPLSLLNGDKMCKMGDKRAGMQ